MIYSRLHVTANLVMFWLKNKVLENASWQRVTCFPKLNTLNTSNASNTSAPVKTSRSMQSLFPSLLTFPSPLSAVLRSFAFKWSSLNKVYAVFHIATLHLRRAGHWHLWKTHVVYYHYSRSISAAYSSPGVSRWNPRHSFPSLHLRR